MDRDLDRFRSSPIEREDLPWYVAPLPAVLEHVGLRLVWLVVAVNLAGTAFGFWFYGPQLSRTPMEMWIFVPDSPVATLFIAGALAAWKLGHPQEWLTALAFFGNIKLGLWTVYIHLTFWPYYDFLHPAMRQFLIWSHFAMVIQAFLLYRISDFPPWAVGVALAWYTLDTIVDYFVPIVGEPHHTVLPTPSRDTELFLGADALGVAAAGAVAFMLLATYLAMLTRVEKQRVAREIDAAE
ncbi:MAG: DUF1405 domain-containing protein [Natronomonas sp.]